MHFQCKALAEVFLYCIERKPHTETLRHGGPQRKFSSLCILVPSCLSARPIKGWRNFFSKFTIGLPVRSETSGLLVQSGLVIYSL